MNLTSIKRWIKASMIQVIRSNLEGAKLYIEGEDQLTNRDPTHFELRIDGPYLKPCGTAGEFRAFIEVNILVNSTRSESNLFERENLQGAAAHALNRDFCIKKTGNVGTKPEDDETDVGIMKLLPVDEIKISDFGRIETTTEVYQASVEGHYEMYFSLSG